MIGALVAEVSRNPELDAAFRERVTGPRRAALITRLSAEPDRLTAGVAEAVDLLIGPVYFRALLGGMAVEELFVESVLRPLIRPVAIG